MTNELTRVIDAIKADPHGEVARQASHWLAVEVMHGELLHRGWRGSSSDLSWDNSIYAYEIDGEVIFVNKWRPLTDANHTRMLVRKVFKDICLYKSYVGEGNYSVHYGENDYHELDLDPYGDDITHDACQVLRKCHAEGTLTDEILKGF